MSNLVGRVVRRVMLVDAIPAMGTMTRTILSDSNAATIKGSSVVRSKSLVVEDGGVLVDDLCFIPFERILVVDLEPKESSLGNVLAFSAPKPELPDDIGNQKPVLSAKKKQLSPAQIAYRNRTKKVPAEPAVPVEEKVAA